MFFCLLYDHLRMQDQEDDQEVDMTNDKNIVTGIYQLAISFYETLTGQP